MSSYSAFNDVDDTVSKPVLGSDGAARWQDFKGNNKLPTSKSSLSVAPAIPLKKLDRVLGTKSIRDERTSEVKIRKEAGDREMGSGYTVFKRNTDQEEIAEKKRQKLVLDRVRPDDVPYFIQTETFEGYKFDYVFTTKDLRGTGYYWDGMDSMKKEMGLAPTHSSLADNNDDTKIESSQSTTKRKKKKRKKVHDASPIFEPDEFNPHEQVAAALLRRKQAMEAPPSTSVSIANNTRSDAEALGADSRALNIPEPVQKTLEPELVAAGWQSTKDPASGKIYYYKRSTNERSWKKPELPSKREEEQLPDGWKATKDATSGKVYYYHTSGKTSWQRPPLM